jgi:hypothetical protein
VVVFDGVGLAGSQPRAARLKTANMPTYFFIVALQMAQWSSRTPREGCQPESVVTNRTLDAQGPLSITEEPGERWFIPRERKNFSCILKLRAGRLFISPGSAVWPRPSLA